MAEEKKSQFKCNGDCLNCRENINERKTQWQYCAVQFTYNSMRMIEVLGKELNAMKGVTEQLQEKIEAIQNNEASVLNPTEDETVIANKHTALSGEGAE